MGIVKFADVSVYRNGWSGINPFMETAMINEVRDTFARRNWHPFGKILVSDVPEAFALIHAYNCLQCLKTSYPDFPA